ncbi:MAG: lipoyl protein ligase domain-containing protein [Desulfomonilaceae bacterium]
MRALSAAANMALDNIILEEISSGYSPTTFRFLQFKPAAALVGYNQDVDLEIRKDFCKAHRIDINRRITGGGAILFQESALGWEIFGSPGVHPFLGQYEDILYRICSIAARALSRLGINASFRPRNDIEVNGRKISGTGGAFISGAMMFQGTVLIENETELFLKSLRVPVEKLKKREIESLMQRICFLNDLVQPSVSLHDLKSCLVSEFSESLAMDFYSDELTDREAKRLNNELGFYSSPEWIFSRSRPKFEGEPIRAITQSPGGSVQAHLWLAPGGKRVRQALMTGDFFTVPQRLCFDLESYLIGSAVTRPALMERVLSFFDSYDGVISGVDPELIAELIAEAADRLKLLRFNFSLPEVNELFFINLCPQDLPGNVAKYLLLPYCSKNLDCDFREIEGCSECGACEIGYFYKVAHEFNLEPLTIQSFEHLMTTLHSKVAQSDGIYIGSCCEAFYSKHKLEMESAPASGVLVNIDSTTCYDLGKGTDAYKGKFDNKTFLNNKLLEKIIGLINGQTASM